MKQELNAPYPQQLDTLCNLARTLITEKRYEECIPHLRRAMEDYPHAPHPHNLMGILLEKTNDHLLAMKHFRAAWALDPTYRPAGHNLDTYGTFYAHGRCAFDERDLPDPQRAKFATSYDGRGNGRIVKKTEIRPIERLRRKQREII